MSRILFAVLNKFRIYTRKVKIAVSRFLRRCRQVFDAEHRCRKNPKTPLTIKTYDGGNQSMHPKMLYFQKGWNGYRFWYVTTPYKNWNDFIENPCVYCSNDGINYEPPMEDMNPLDAVTGDAAINFNSDPHLVYNDENDTLECWWRLNKTQKSGELGEYLFRRITRDGKTWSEKELIHESRGARLACVSPAIIFEDGIYKIWASHSINDDRHGRVIQYFESRSGSDWQHIRDITIPNSTHDFSHMDIIHTDAGYEAILQGIDKITGELNALFYSQSDDNITYTKAKLILERGKRGRFDDWRLYRPSLTKVDQDYYLYYGATSTTNCKKDWGTGLIVYHDINELLRSV